jgi:alcohol dehydrogenase (cytochrome c)
MTRRSGWVAIGALLFLQGLPACRAEHPDPGGGEQEGGREPAGGGVVTPATLLDPPAGSWLTYGRDYTNQRYSPLAQIDRRNVSRLVPRIVFQTAIERLSGFQTSPVMAGGVLYVTTPFNILIAYDLRAGRELWRYQHKLGPTILCCGPVNRGAAIGHGMVYMATLDARVVALDARTGELRWEVQDNDPEAAYSLTLAPLLVGDRLIVGTAGAEYGIRGNVTAYRASTGERLWRWYAIPSPEEGGWWGSWTPTTPTGDSLNRDIAREKADSARFADAWKTGGGSVWTTPAYDPALGLLFVVVVNPSPEYDGSVRPGDNLYTVSVVALDVESGKLRWHHQYVPHDQWDSDASNPPILVEDGDGKLVVHAGKTGWVYVLDAATGRLVRRSDAFVPQDGLFSLPTPQGVRRAPGAAGGASWQPSAFSPGTGYVYVPAFHLPMLFTTHPEPYVKGQLFRGSDESTIPNEPTWSTLSAVDLATGKIAWQVKTGDPLGGALATAGGLLFVGENSGWFKAYDAGSGEVLWQFQCGAGVNAPPVTFSLDGEQLVAVAAGGSFYDGHLGNAVFVFGMPKAYEP